MSKKIVEHDGKRWWHTELPSGAIIETEIVEEHEHPEVESKEYKLLKRIAKKLDVEIT